MLRLLSPKILHEASWNINFTDELNKDIEQVLGTIIDYYFSKSQETIKYESWEVTDPYSNTKFNICLRLCSKETSDEMLKQGIISKGAIAGYDSKTNTLNVFPYNIPPTPNRQQLEAEFRTYIQHELVHALDPKMKLLHSSPPGGTPEYYSSPVEFDSHSKQITEYLRSQISQNPTVKQLVLNWLRTSELNSQNPLYDFSRPVKAWEQSDAKQGTDLIRRFKTRLYNELFTEGRSHV